MVKKKMDQLRDALGEVSRVEMDQVLERREYDPEFTRRMLSLAEKKLAKNRRILLPLPSPHIPRLAKGIASILLISALSGSFTLTVNAKARESFMIWMRESFGNVVNYFSDVKGANLSTKITFRPTWLPDGYSLDYEDDYSIGVDVHYLHESGNLLIFSCLADPEAGGTSVILEHSEYRPVTINGHAGDLYDAYSHSKNSVLVWTDGQYLFTISGVLPSDLLIKMAESVQ